MDALHGRLEKKLDGNYTRLLRTILNKSWRQHPTRHQLYGHLPPITKTIQVRRTRHAGHCWRSRDELISDVLLWTPTYGRAKAGRPARTYIQQLCEDTRCSHEDQPEAMNDRGKWQERVKGYPCYQHDMMMMMIYICKLDSALNNLQCLMCHKTKLNKTQPNQSLFYIMIFKSIWSIQENTTLKVYTRTHTHTHTRAYIYIYIYISCLIKETKNMLMRRNLKNPRKNKSKRTKNNN